MKKPGQGIGCGTLDPEIRESLANGMRLQLDRAVVALRKGGKPMTAEEVAKKLGVEDGYSIAVLMDEAFESHGIYREFGRGMYRLVTADEKAAGMNKHGVFDQKLARRVRLATYKGARAEARLVCADGRWYAGYDYSCSAGLANSGGPCSVRESFASEAEALEDVRAGAVRFFRDHLRGASRNHTLELQTVLGKLATPEQRAELETAKISKRKRNPHQRETGGGKRGGSGATQSGPSSRERREVAASAAPSTPPVECGSSTRMWFAYLTTFAARRNGTPIVDCAAFEVSMQVEARRSPSVAWICVVEAETEGSAIAEAARMWNAGDGELTAGGTQAGIVQPSPKERATSKKEREGDAGAPVRAKAKRASHVDAPAVAAGGMVARPHPAVNVQPDGRVLISFPVTLGKAGWEHVFVKLSPLEAERLRRDLRQEKPARAVDARQLELFGQSGRGGRDGLGGAQG